MKKYIVVGGVAGGMSAAARLRRLDENAQVIVLDKGPFVSFSNCCLPYNLGGVVKTEEELILMTPEKLNARYNLDVRINSYASSIDSANNTITIQGPEGEYTETYDKLVLSPGAKAIVPPFEGLDLMPNFTLKTVPDTSKINKFINEQKPKHVTVIGGGFIGVETAENLKERGLEVTLVEALDHILKPFDIEMAQYAQMELVKHGIKLEVGERVTKFDAETVYLESGKEIKTDGVIMAIGVAPDTDFMENSGIEMEDRGYIRVDSNFQTSHNDVYAVGDAIKVYNNITNKMAPLALAGPANKEGRIVADLINDKENFNKGFIGASVLKVFDFNLASVGVTEELIAFDGLDFDYKVVYAAPKSNVGLMPNSRTVYLKLIFTTDGTIIGAQAVSESSADKTIDILSVAMKLGASVYDLRDLELTYAPPFATGKNPVNFIGYIASNVLDGLNSITFKELIDKEQTQQIVDVREEDEFVEGHLNGAINIPMSEFRDRLDEFDQDCLVHCRSGERSYNVVSALTQKGIKATNVSGSFLFMEEYDQAMVNLYGKETKVSK